MDLNFSDRAGGRLHRIPRPAAVLVMTPVVLAGLTPTAADIAPLARGGRRWQVYLRDHFAGTAVTTREARDNCSVASRPQFTRVPRSSRLCRCGCRSGTENEECQTCRPRYATDFLTPAASSHGSPRRSIRRHHKLELFPDALARNTHARGGNAIHHDG